MNKKNIIIVVVIVLVLIIFGFWQYKVMRANTYSVVYLTTGEVYVGKLTTFPDLQLKDAYILGTTKDATDPTKNNFQLNPISEALWSPQSIHLTKENVVFYGRLMSDSKIAQTLADQLKQ